MKNNLRMFFLLAMLFWKDTTPTSMLFRRQSIDSCPVLDPLTTVTVTNLKLCAIRCLILNNCGGVCFHSDNRCRTYKKVTSSLGMVNDPGFKVIWDDSVGGSPDFRKVYEFQSAKKNFADAITFCQGAGAILALPKNDEENDFIYRVTANSSDDEVWIGIDDRQNELSFVNTSSGAIAGYKNFQDGEPSDDHGKNCVILQRSKSSQWKPIKCGENHTFVCERLLP
ncbi:collectin-10-like [Macrobrachium rosenbergii]|uniref:collectin-10-like n=1 Tax=Macrobrachium rosenbergii TaxID=79674 RepID=UPI0034D51107